MWTTAYWSATGVVMENVVKVVRVMVVEVVWLGVVGCVEEGGATGELAAGQGQGSL